MAGTDKYGIPPGGNTGAYVAKKFNGFDWTLTWDEVIASVALGGWPKSLWATAGAVCAAESSRNPFIYNTYKKGHFGLFQISRSDHADFFGSDGNSMVWLVPWENAKEGYSVYRSQGWGAWSAHTNGGYLAFLAQAKAAAAAFTAKHGTTEDSWMKAYRQGTTDRIFVAYIDGSPGQVKPGVGQALAGAIAGAASGVANATVGAGQGAVSGMSDTVSTVAGMAQVVTGLWNSLTTPSLWMRLAYGVTGVALVAGGLYLVVSRTAVQQGVQQVIKSAAKGTT